MENCLKMQLRAAVDNPDLPILGVFKFKIAAGTHLQVVSGGSEGNNVAGGNGISFSSYSGSSPYDNPFILTDQVSGFRITSTGQNNVVTITRKYQLRPNGAEFQLSGISELPDGLSSVYVPETATSLTFKGWVISVPLADIVNIPSIKSVKSNIVAFNIESSLFSGDISTILGAFPNIKNIGVSGTTGITGDISHLTSTKLENIALLGSRVGGTIESFVAAQRAGGRTTGTVSGNSGGWGQVTFDGATTHAKGAVSWTANTITMDGVTINA